MSFAELTVVIRLVFAHMWRRPGRVLLTSLSTVAAACIVVWVVSGYDSLVGQFGGMGEEYVGRYDFLLVPSRDREANPTPGPGGFGRANQLSKELVDRIRMDPVVATAKPVFETALRARKADDTDTTTVPPVRPSAEQPDSGPRVMGGVAEQNRQSKVPTVVGTDSTEPLHAIVRGQWFDPKAAGRTEGALTREAAEQLGVGVGDELVVASGLGASRTETKVKIVAVVEQSKRLPGPKFMVGLPPTRPRGASRRGQPPTPYTCRSSWPKNSPASRPAPVTSAFR